MPDQIFISYRRDDAAYVTGHINDLLRKEFGNESVFTDVDNIALGVDFRAVLDESVSQCQVLLAVIGDNWLTVKSRDGKPRLHDPADFVRIEIESALKRNIPVIPLLVSGATMPLEEDLPGSLKDLAFRNGTQIRPAPDFSLDMDRLIRNLRAYLQSMRGDGADDQPILDVPLSDEAEQQTSHAETAAQGDADGSESSGEKILVGDDERARKQVELGISHRPSGKRWATRLSLIAIVVLAGGSWYYADQNPEQFEALFSTVQPADSEIEESGVADEVVEPILANDADSDENLDVGAPTSFSAAATPETAEESVADSDDGVASIDDAEVAAEESAAGTASVDDAEALPEAAEESMGESADALDVVEVTLTENVETEDVEPDGTVDGEIVLTPRTQRRVDVSAFLSEGVSLAAVGDHESAIQKFNEAIELDPEAPFLYKQRGASFHSLGQYEAAVSDFGVAVRLNSEDVNAFYNRGASHFALQDYAATVADYDAVIQLDPKLVEAYRKRADAHEALGNDGEAARDRATAAVFESNRN